MTDTVRQPETMSTTARLLDLVYNLSEDAQRAFLRLLEGKRAGDAGDTTRLVTLIKELPEEQKRAFLKMLEDRKQREHRDYFRKKCFISVNYVVEDGKFTDFIENIGVGGVFIQTKKSFAAGKQIMVDLPIPHHGEPVRVTGNIIRTGSDGIGVKFKLDKHQEDMIRTLMDNL